MNQRKGQPEIIFGLSIFNVAHAIQLARFTAQTVLLTNSLRFATLKMSIFFQKRFEGIPRLTAIRVAYPPKVLKFIICVK